ncbi:MAG TPA: hypothetical protein VGF55_09695 [Gemmataceae bacterium]|jgi:hypothetical protein
MFAKVGGRVIAVSGVVAAGWIALAPAPDPPDVTAGIPRHANVQPIRVRIMAKTIVARELLAGRLSLSEAAAVFGWLDRQPPALAARDDDPCRAVAAWAESLAGDGPAEIRRSAGPPPPVNETACRELMNRAAAAVSRDRGLTAEQAAVSDLRLVRPAGLE